MILIAFLMVFLDTFFGIWRTVKLKGWNNVLSKRLSDIFGKLVLYGCAILVVYLIEFYIAADIIAEYIAVELLVTKVVSFAIVYTEIKSIDEKYKEVKGISFLRGLKKFVTRVKEEKDTLNEE